jgi:gliding motility-associated-like protein
MNLEKECELEVDTVSVKFTDFKLALPDTFICRGQEISLDAATTDAVAYRWNDGSDQRKLSLNQAGNYWVSVTVGRCSKTDTVRVKSHAFDLSLGPDLEVCDGRRVVLDPGIAGGNYTWQDGSSNPQFTVTDSGLYRVTVSRGGCQESTAVHVSYKYCVECMHVPNMFTPNGDGTNDVFRVLPRCQVLKYELMILNRYGEAVFTSREPTDSWDGSFRGQPLEPGVYYYLVRASFDRGNDVREEMFKGDISLLR